MQPATTLSDATFNYLRPLIRQYSDLWSGTAGVDSPGFDQVYVPRPGEVVGTRQRQRPPLVERLTRQLTKDRDDTLTLVTGQKGSGKTFALRKVYDDPAIKGRFHRVFVRAGGDDGQPGKAGLPPGDADLRLLLLLLAAEVSREFKNPALIEALREYKAKPELEGALREWAELLTSDGGTPPRNFYEYATKINLSVTELSWKLRSDDQRRRVVREDDHFAPSQLIRLLNALVLALRETIMKIDVMRDLLIIVDDTDKYAFPTEAEAMFLQGAVTLQQIPCKLVVTFPYWLHFDPRYNNIAPGATREVLSNIKVVTRSDPNTPLPVAVDFFREVYTRVASPSLLESEDVLKEAVLLSAGVPREFLRVLAQAFELAIDFGEAAVSLDTVRDAQIVLARDSIATAGTLVTQARLKYVHLTHQVPTVGFWKLLDSLHVVEYVNDEPWYAVNPLLRDWVKERVREDERVLELRGVKGTDVAEQLKEHWLKQAEADD